MSTTEMRSIPPMRAQSANPVRKTMRWHTSKISHAFKTPCRFIYGARDRRTGEHSHRSDGQCHPGAAPDIPGLSECEYGVHKATRVRTDRLSVSEGIFKKNRERKWVFSDPYKAAMTTSAHSVLTKGQMNVSIAPKMDMGTMRLIEPTYRRRK
jgi:hypothetical protein